MATIRPQLTHAGIYVHDINKMRRFYVDVLGLIASDEGSSPRLKIDLVFLSADPATHHQLALASGRPTEAKISTVNQLSFKVASLDELRTMYHRVAEHGVRALTPVNHGMAWSIYFEDPEGNTVEIYLDSPWYVPQPHGAPLDLSLPNEEIERRTEETCRRDKGFMLHSEWQQTMRGKLAGHAA
jgi:catechol 2,3-dioxygenase